MDGLQGVTPTNISMYSKYSSTKQMARSLDGLQGATPYQHFNTTANIPMKNKSQEAGMATRWLLLTYIAILQQIFQYKTNGKKLRWLPLLTYISIMQQIFQYKSNCKKQGWPPGGYSIPTFQFCKYNEMFCWSCVPLWLYGIYIS